jgi:hypothetical protein
MNLRSYPRKTWGRRICICIGDWKSLFLYAVCLYISSLICHVYALTYCNIYPSSYCRESALQEDVVEYARGRPSDLSTKAFVGILIHLDISNVSLTSLFFDLLAFPHSR